MMKLSVLLIVTLLLIATLLLIPTVSAKKPKDIGQHDYQKAVKVHKWAASADLFYLYAKSADKGHPVAQFNLGMMYTNGKSVTIDHQQAVYWYKKSAAQNFYIAQYRLGEMYYLAEGGLNKNVGKAIDLFTNAAEQDEAGAQLNLALIYGSGDEVIVDSKLAFYWLQKAIAQDLEDANMYRSLLINSSKNQFSADQAEYYWTKKAAELGVEDAKVKLAIYQDEGRGLYEDVQVITLEDELSEILETIR